MGTSRGCVACALVAQPGASPFEVYMLQTILPVLVAVTGPIVTLLLAALFGQRMAAYWALRQKRRELVLAAVAEFYRLYGEFFATWKLWNSALRQKPEGPTDETRQALLGRAAQAEGGVETIVMRVATERSLDARERLVLGCFRQGYQSLREAIRDNRNLDWFSSNHPKYVAFKKLACEAAQIVAMSDAGARPPADRAAEALLAITSNDWEERWSTALDSVGAATPGRALPPAAPKLGTGL
ncbi:hypothetical protein [Polyangium sp. y55x31]|uniref:hypothetical protein n=1 Tax=Polyangium sp. y55x31 TaxID=3042688 RepID=UPI002482E2A9|nr:hypothetical protein [Polyangium sp. y55x31]MDI1483450.1 hypothetical protein [Polyangium sp. y55x31]